MDALCDTVILSAAITGDTLTLQIAQVLWRTYYPAGCAYK